MMDYSYSILMFIFSGMLLLYALIVHAGGTMLLPYSISFSAKGRTKDYIRKFSKIIGLVGCAPLASGIAGLIWPVSEIWWPAVLTLIIGFTVTIWAGTKLIKKVM